MYFTLAQEHFVVLYKIKKTISGFVFYVADPAEGKLKFTEKTFSEYWMAENNKGVAILLNPTEKFYQQKIKTEKGSSLKNIIEFAKVAFNQFKLPFIKAFILVLITSGLLFIPPVIMKKVIDEGVLKQNLSIIQILLISQLCILLSETLTRWGGSIMLSKINMRLSINHIAHFILKIIRLPIYFFDTKLYTDFLGRIEDQGVIQNFLTHRFIQTAFSVFLLIVFSVLLGYYNISVLFLFAGVSILSILWVVLFLNKSQYINYRRFNLRILDQNLTTEMIVGMPEIKVNNAQNNKLNEWNNLQEEIYKINIVHLKNQTYQNIGYQSLTHLKNILITFFCAYWIINNQMTLGTMLAISYIVGELNVPIDHIIHFIVDGQKAKICFDRISDIHSKPDEIKPEQIFLDIDNYTIEIKDLSFRYGASYTPFVLKNINVSIPYGKTIAIVGSSGSGKTTLLKLLLLFYHPQEGGIFLNQDNLAEINPDSWRQNCGLVMQDGYIYSGSIAENITFIPYKDCDQEWLKQVCEYANLQEWIDKLPLCYESKIGKSGLEISGGQKQRILIARRCIKNLVICFLMKPQAI